MGVPEPQIRMKMVAEGAGPDVITDPERLLPAAAAGPDASAPAADSSDEDTDSD